MVCVPFDAELFGHWWFEGPKWLYHVLHEIHNDPEIETATMGSYIDKNHSEETVSLPEGSWGEGGFHWIWLNDDTRWTWKHLYNDERAMKAAVRKYSDNDDDLTQKLLCQLARELVLAESSDWQFLISTFSAKDYAELRFTRHHEDFNTLLGLLEKAGTGNELTDVEFEQMNDIMERDKVFEEIDPSWWMSREY
jgi:1,4-alpha-glucan branching enzyme